MRTYAEMIFINLLYSEADGTSVYIRHCQVNPIHTHVHHVQAQPYEPIFHPHATSAWKFGRIVWTIFLAIKVLQILSLKVIKQQTHSLNAGF